MVSIAHGNPFLRHKGAGGSAMDGAVLFALLPLLWIGNTSFEWLGIGYAVLC